MSPSVLIFFGFFPDRKMKLSIISWNVNGSRNVDKFPGALKLVCSKSVVLLQETYEIEGGRYFCPRKFVRFSSPARATAGRPSGGLATLIARDFASNAVIRRIDSPISHLLPIYISKPGVVPIILG